MAFSIYSAHIPRCQHIKTNGTQCGSPALHRQRFCYFHNRWRAANINLKRASTARAASILELPVLEDADSIQVALMQVLRLILTRQLDHKTGGLILYGLQTASANLRHTTLDPRNKENIIIDPRHIADTSVGEAAWDSDDFEEEDFEEEEQEEDQEEEDNAAVNAARTSPKRQSKQPSPATGAVRDAARDTSQSSPPAPSALKNQSDEREDLQRIEAALEGAEQGSLRDLKTVFEFVGLYPRKAPSHAAATGSRAARPPKEHETPTGSPCRGR